MQTFPRHGVILLWPLGKMEQNACPSHLIGWRVLSDQNHKVQRDQEDALALGRGPSKIFWSRKGYYAKEVVLAYQDYSKVFEIYTDASNKQQGAVITRENRLIAFSSQRLSTMKCKYSVTKIELLAIVKTLTASLVTMFWREENRTFWYVHTWFVCRNSTKILRKNKTRHAKIYRTTQCTNWWIFV